MLIVYHVPTARMMLGETNMLLIGMIAVIVGLLYVAERSPDSDSQQREKLKLDKQLYLNLRSKQF